MKMPLKKQIIRKACILVPAALFLLLIIIESLSYTTSLLKILEIWLNFLPFLILVVVCTMKRPQRSILDALLEVSFYFYCFQVLLLTIYIIPFAGIIESLVNAIWLDDLKYRLSQNQGFSLTRMGVNLIPLRKFIIYPLSHRQVLGNLVMLFPLGIYLPLLFLGLRKFKKAVLYFVCTAFLIECTQLLFTFITPMSAGHYFRIFDIDDILLNGIGACIGYGCYHIAARYLSRRRILESNAHQIL